MRLAILVACIAACVLLPGGTALPTGHTAPDDVGAGAACQGLVAPCIAVEAHAPLVPDVPDVQLPAGGLPVELDLSPAPEPARQEGTGLATATASREPEPALPLAVKAAGGSALAATVAALAAWLAAKLPWGTQGGRRLLRVLTLAPVALFSRLQADELLENPARQAMLEHLRVAPGATLRDAQRAAGVAWGTAVYHLQRLEHEGHVVSVRQGAHRRFWVCNTRESAQRRQVAPLLDAEARRLAQAVVAQPGATQATLAAAAGVSTATACRRLRTLAAAGLVLVTVAGRERRYAAAQSLPGLLGPDLVRVVPPVDPLAVPGVGDAAAVPA